MTVNNFLVMTEKSHGLLAFNKCTGELVPSPRSQHVATNGDRTTDLSVCLESGALPLHHRTPIAIQSLYLLNALFSYNMVCQM